MQVVEGASAASSNDGQDDDSTDEEGEDNYDGIGDMFNEDPSHIAATEDVSPSLEPSPLIPTEEGNCCSSLRKTCKKWKELYDNYYKIIRVAITSTVVLILDMGSDLLTTVAHFKRCHWWWGAYTALFVILSLSWIGYTLLKREMWKHKDFQEKWKKRSLIICLILQILIFYWIIWKAGTWVAVIRERRNAKKRLKRDIGKFKKIKAKEHLLEGGPQLSLQSYILLKKIRSYMSEKHCQDNCSSKYGGVFNNTPTAHTTGMMDWSFSGVTCIDRIQIIGMIISLLALSYSQAFIYPRGRLWKKLMKLFIYIPLISIRMFIPAVLGVFGNKIYWYLAPVSALVMYTILFYIRQTYTKNNRNLPEVLQMVKNKNKKVQERKLKDILYWGLNHMLFNVSTVSGLAISFPYMICALSFLVVDFQREGHLFYLAAATLSVICVLINVIFVLCFRDKGKQIIPFSDDP